jgi:hypothetical protein
LISGDCPLIDVSFINRLVKQFEKHNGFNFIESKKEIIHEGIKLFKTKAWNKVHKLSKDKIFLEHPGYIVKKKPEEFKIFNYKSLKYEQNKKYRISVDTLSDLEFLNYIFFRLNKQKKEFNIKNLLKLKKIHLLNKHVLQRAPLQKKFKVAIVTSKNGEIGLGHYNRSLILKREISERYNSTVKIININLRSDLKKIKILNKNFDLKIFDLPKIYLNKIKKIIYDFKQTIIIDQILKSKKLFYLIPNLISKKNKDHNIFGGVEYIILNRNIIFNNLTNVDTKKKIEKLLMIGGAFSIDKEIYDFMINNKLKLKIVIGPLVNKKILKKLNNEGYSLITNPKNIFEIIKSSKEIYCRFGISTFETVALGLRPIVFQKNNQKDKKIIRRLYLKGYFKIYNLEKRANKALQQIDISKNLDNVINVIDQVIC